MERSQFCPSRADVEEGFHQIMSTVICADEVKSRLLEKLDKCLIQGDGHNEISAAFNGVLKGHEWSWPWLEEWQAKFASAARLPYLWDSLKMTKQNAASLLGHSIIMRIYSIGRARDALNSMQCSPNRWELIFLFLGCPVEQEIAESTGHACLENLPPFFPGDRTRIRCRRMARQEI